MNDEIEEGELNSDVEENDEAIGRAQKAKTASEETLNINVNNPYDQEDEAILQLKIKALQSLLDTQSSTPSTSSKPPKSKSSSRIQPHRSMSKKRQQFKPKQRPRFSSFKKKLLTRRPLKPYSSQTYHGNPKLTKDNYDIQDMDIEPSSTTLNLTSNNPLSCLTNLTNQSLPLNLYGFNPNTHNQSIEQLYHVHQPFFPHNSTFEQVYQRLSLQLANQLAPQALYDTSSVSNGPHCSSTSHFSSLGYSHFEPTQSLYSPPQTLTLEQQQNELNELIEAQFQQEQLRSRSQLSVDIKMPEQVTPPVIFTLSSPSNSISSSKASLSPLQDVDERFIDKTTTRLDIDYRQPDETPPATQKITAISSEVDEVLVGLNNKIASVDVDSHEKEKILKANLLRKLLEVKKKTEEVPKDDPEKEMAELRSKLLANMAKKKQVKKLDDDMTQFRRKLIEHELMIEEKKTLIEDGKTTQSTVKKVSTMVASPVAPTTRKISPVIIRLNDSSSDDDDYVEAAIPICDATVIATTTPAPPPVSLQDNITQFLKEAKNQAEILALHSLLPNNKFSKRKLSPQRPHEETKKQMVTAKVVDEEKKSLIKSLRDKINLETNQIVGMQSCINGLKIIEGKKEKAIEITKLKIETLREQLTAAEKVLSVNQQAVVASKAQRAGLDVKLEQLQNGKKLKQLLLQKLLAKPHAFANAQSMPVIESSRGQTTQKSPPSQIKVKPVEPLPVETKQPVIEVTINNKNISPPLPEGEPPVPSPSAQPAQPPQPPLPPSEVPIKQPAAKRLKSALKLSPMTLGEVVAATAKSSDSPRKTIIKLRTTPSTTTYSSTTRPNLSISKQTDKKLEQLAKDSSILQPSNIVKLVNAQVVNTRSSLESKKTDMEEKKQDLRHRQKVIDRIDSLLKSTSSHCESMDIWCFESMTQASSSHEPLVLDIKSPASVVNLTSNCDPSLFTREKPMKDKLVPKNDLYMIDDVMSYESPLKVFRGYRFNSSFTMANQFDEAYSKFYCNAIDFRKPFCPFDMHGSCKDSNCAYQHLNVMTMDNLQRTEHLLSYCPEMIGLTTANPSQKEAVKKLKTYAKQFMNSNLNKMSIKDYFKYLYDLILINLKPDLLHNTVLSRATCLLTNHNKSFGIQEVQQATPQLQATIFPTDRIEHLLEIILSVNMSRSFDVKLKYAMATFKFNVDWLRNEHETNEYLTKEETTLAWIYHAQHVYLTSKTTEDASSSLYLANSIQKLLNVLSNALEASPDSEFFWLIYLKVYSMQKNAASDYHEVCFLCMDNLVTYDLIWFMMNTCSIEYTQTLIEAYEKCLLSLTSDEQICSFEQSDSDCTVVGSKVSFYLMELIFYDINLKLTNSDSAEDGKQLLSKYLQRTEITSRLEPNDLCLIWLCAIHLEAFLCLPNMIRANVLLNCRVVKDFETKKFWRLHSSKRTFNRSFFKRLTSVYSRISDQQKNVKNRHCDSFLLPWNFNYACTIEKIQSLFYEALKAINQRLSLSTHKEAKQLTRLISLPLFINLITLEISNKRHEVAAKLCQRLLKSSDAEVLKELWISNIFIHSSQRMDNSSAAIESTIMGALKIFPMDAQITFISAQYYASVNQQARAVELIEVLIESFFFEENSNVENKFKINDLFKVLLNYQQKTLDSSHPRVLASNKEKAHSQQLCISVCFCYYMELKSFSHELVTKAYEDLIKKLKLQSQRAIMWTRYFKYVAVNSIGNDATLQLIEDCVHSMNELDSSTNELIVPFYYVFDNDSSVNRGCCDNNVIKNGHVATTDLYYSNNFDSRDENLTANQTASKDYYYHNCLVDLWMKLYTRTALDRTLLAKYLMGKMPLNTSVIRLFVHNATKTRGVKVTLQTVYDHLTLNLVNNESVWILCIKLCLTLNDLQQAILMYQQGEAMCTRGSSSVTALKRLAGVLFPRESSP